jgi:hypothetical protein
MAKGDELKKLVLRVNKATDPATMAELLTEIAARSFYLSGEVARHHKMYLEAEQERKTRHAVEKMSRMSTGMSAAKADAEAEVAIEGNRRAEVMAQCEWMALRNMHEGIRDVMTALQMRLAYERDEAKRTQTIQTT